MSEKQQPIYVGTANNKQFISKYGEMEYVEIYLSFRNIFTEDALNNLEAILKPEIFEHLTKSKAGNSGLNLEMWKSKNKEYGDFSLKVKTFKPKPKEDVEIDKEGFINETEISF